MNLAEAFIVNGHIPDIQYQTDAPQEMVCPRITVREGVSVVYMHNKRDEGDGGFIPVAEFLSRLARQESGLAVTAYRANGKQTTITFAKQDRVTLSTRMTMYLSALSAPRDSRSTAVVNFIGSLAPLYAREYDDGVVFARSLQDGTVLLPIGALESDPDYPTIRVWWQGDPGRTSLVSGEDIAALALERYVRFHGVGATEEAIAAELWYMARHFRLKTASDACLPQLTEPRGRVAELGRQATQMGQGVLVNLVSKLMGI